MRAIKFQVFTYFGPVDANCVSDRLNEFARF